MDGSKASNVAIAQAMLSDTVGLKFGSGAEDKTFTFSASENTISNILFDTTGSGSTNNTLAFTNGVSTIAKAIAIGASNDLAIALGSPATRESEANLQDVSLLLAEGLSNNGGVAKIKVVGNSSVSGGDINISALNYDSTANFAIQNSSATFGTLTASQSSTLTLDGSQNAVNVVVTKLDSNSLIANFAGHGEGREAVLKISDSNDSNKTITLAGLSVADGSTHNTLDLSALTKATVSGEVNIEGSEDLRKGLTIKLQDTELSLGGGMTTSNATTTVRVGGTTGSGAKLSGGDIQITNLDMVGTGDLKTTLAATSTEIATLTAQGGTSNKLLLDGSSSAVNGVIGAIIGEDLQVELNGNSHGATLAINGEGGVIKSVSATNGDATKNALSLQSGKLIVTDKIDSTLVASGEGLTLEFAGNSELSLSNGIDTTSGGNVNISVKGKITPNAREKVGGEDETPIEGIISGGDIKIDALSFADGAILQIRNTEATFATVSGSGVLSLDGANTTGGVKATVTSGISTSSNAIIANFNGRSDKGNELVLSNDSMLKTITFGANSVNNKISLAGSKTLTLSDQVIVSKGSGITFALANSSTLNLTQGMSGEGTSTLRVESTQSSENHSTLKGGVFRASVNGEEVTTGVEITNLDLIAYIDGNTSGGTNNKAAKLTIQASEVTIGKVTAQEGDTALILDATSNNVLTTVNAISGKTLAIDLKSSGDNEARLALRGKGNPVKSFTISAGTKNVLDLDNASIAIADKVAINSNKALSVNLANGRYVAIKDKTEIDGGVMTFNFLSGLSEVGGAGIEVKSGGTLNLNVGVENASGARALIGALSNTGVANLVFKGNADIFFFDPASSTASKLDLTSIASQGNGNIVDIASSRFGTNFDVNYTRKDFRVLQVGNGSASALPDKTLSFKVFVDKTQSGGLTIGGETMTGGNSTNYGYAYSDRIILESKTSTADAKAVTHNLLIIPKIDQLGQITYNGGGTEVEGNVAVATVKNGSGVSFATEKVVSGFEVIQAELVAEETDANGKSNNGTKEYTTYFLESVKSVGASEEMQDVANTALSINYDLYMANLNSLNKRMGELRDNPYNQGVWARVFGGSQESSFGIGSKTDYVTIQAGYDYDFTFGDAKNYLGVAFSYATSTSKSFTTTQSITNSNASSPNTVGIENIKSGAYEVAVYNSYVSDSGWYNDSIAKFSYIDSSFNLTGSTYDSQTTNMAFTLSNEVGYRYKFAENQSGGWYIDPQLELAFGYLNQSDFNSKIASSAASSGFSTLDAYQDAIMTLRGRIGASLGKKFNTQKGFASVYVGAFYEYDYVNGGASDIEVGSGASNNLTPLDSSGRAVINVGSNIALTDSARLYIDVEKSFGDKFKTHMQFNFGARYSFGEKTPISPKNSLSTKK